MDITDKPCYITTLYYYLDNHFEDEGGFVVYNILQYIRPYMLKLLLHHKESMTFEVKPGEFIEVFYQEEEEE